MKWTSRCVCGAFLSIDDQRQTYIHAGGGPDANGRVFRYELDRDRWLNEHSQCLELARRRSAKDNTDSC